MDLLRLLMLSQRVYGKQLEQMGWRMEKIVYLTTRIVSNLPDGASEEDAE
jgi:hypothetical protein